MKAYLITTGSLFAVLAALHIFVLIERWRTLASDPWPAIALALSAALAVWAWRLIRIPAKPWLHARLPLT